MTDTTSMTSPHEEALLPCPFCGGEAEIVHIENGENTGGSCVSCKQCLASSNVEFEFKENFVSNWNRRAALASPKQEPVGYVYKNFLRQFAMGVVKADLHNKRIEKEDIPLYISPQSESWREVAERLADVLEHSHTIVGWHKSCELALAAFTALKEQEHG